MRLSDYEFFVPRKSNSTTIFSYVNNFFLKNYNFFVVLPIYVLQCKTEDKTMNVDFEIRDRVTTILIECRKERALSQKELAAAIGSKETTVASWEQGKSLPSIDMLYRLAKYYGKTMDYMYGEKTNDD